MITATLGATASVNYPPYGWGPIAGPPNTWRDVVYMPEMSSWNSNGRPAAQVFDQGDHIAIHIIDKVALLPNAHPEWITEIRSDGSSGTRPNGVSLSYMIPKQEVMKHGLPHRSQIEAAFREDAHNILKKAYAEQKWFPIEQTRSFNERSEPHDRDWQQIEQSIQKGNFSNFSKTETQLPSKNRVESVGKQVWAVVSREKWSRRGIIGGVVTLGATLSAVAWALTRHKSAEWQEGQSGHSR